MRVKVDKTEAGLHPDEIVVVIEGEDGPEGIVVHSQSIKNQSLEVGQPVARRGKKCLIELPAETSSGAWRIWVDEDLLTGGALAGC